MKICLMSLITREMKNSTIMWYYYESVGKDKNTDSSKAEHLSSIHEALDLISSTAEREKKHTHIHTHCAVFTYNVLYIKW